MRNGWGHHGLFGEGPGGGHGHGWRGGRPGQRIFDHGDIRFVILSLLAEKSSYGYELIKAIEDRLHGAYAPSPGLVYPTLTMLEEIKYVSAQEADGGKKLYSITSRGRSFLKASKSLVDRIMDRMEHAAALHRRIESPQLVRAMQNLQFTLRLKGSSVPLTDRQIRAIADALDEAARKIEQC
jgi:DNA-binding PadR family transcriptional regulator